MVEPDAPTAEWPLRTRALAAYGLAGSRLALPAGPLPDDEWAALFQEAVRHRLVGLLAGSVADGALQVSPVQRAHVARAHASAMARALDIEAAALDVVEMLHAAGVGVRVLKGLATAHLDMRDPSRREFADVDLLLEPGRFTDGVAALARAGLPRDLPERRHGFDDRFGKEATLYTGAAVEIDLHRTLALGSFGLALDPASLWEEGERFTVGGRVLHALRPEARLLHACYAAMLADRSPRLVALRDAAQLAARDDLDAGAVVEMARRARGGIVVAGGLRMAGAAFGTGPEWPLWEWAVAYRPSRWERLSLSAYESHGGTNTTTLLSGALGLGDMRSRAAYVRALVFPDRAYVRARRREGRPSEWSRGLRELLRLAKRPPPARPRVAGDGR